MAARFSKSFSAISSKPIARGLGVNNPDGSPKPLHLVPGVRVPRTEKIRDQRDVPVPELAEGKVTLPADELEHPSYVLYHYERDSIPSPSTRSPIASGGWSATKPRPTAIRK